MTEFPVPLDNLIAYVKALHPEGGPLGNLSDAMVVSARLDDQSDALIGYFVDQARRAGASWSQIGSSMGVSKQAAQKRFVPRGGGGLVPDGEQLFSRLTPRARNVLAAGGRLAGDQAAGAAHLAAALLTEPEGLGARIIQRAGLTGEQVCAAVGAGPAAAGGDAGAAVLRELSFTEDGEAALRGTLKAALRLGHNYIGTEHVLLGILFAGGPAGQALASSGLDAETAERLLAAELAELRARLKTG
jgi:Clp amino terminal domain, pathogenicity island component